MCLLQCGRSFDERKTAIWEDDILEIHPPLQCGRSFDERKTFFLGVGFTSLVEGFNVAAHLMSGRPHVAQWAGIVFDGLQCGRSFDERKTCIYAIIVSCTTELQCGRSFDERKTR